MWKYISKNWKPWAIILVILVVLVGLGHWWQKKQVAENSTETKLGNPKRSEEAVADDFYYNQLTDVEEDAYQTLKGALDQFQGGVIEFSQALTGLEYERVTHALEYGPDDYFYAIMGIPMGADNLSLTYDTQDVTKVEEALVKKCILFLYCAEDVDKNGKFDEKGYVTNLDEISKGLSTNSQEKREEIEDVIAQTNQILDQIVSELPKEYGQKETVDYFLKWMEDNLVFDEDALYASSSISNMSGIFSQIAMKTNLPCVIEKKALAAGYGRVLAGLCNRAGMQAHLVTGTWRDGDAYAMTCVNIDGQDIYVDAANQQSKDLWNQRYLSYQEAKNVFTMADYFSYENKE